MESTKKRVMLLACLTLSLHKSNVIFIKKLFDTYNRYYYLEQRIILQITSGFSLLKL